MGLFFFLTRPLCLFVLWLEFINSSWSQRYQDGNDIIFLCICVCVLHLWGGGCDMRACIWELMCHKLSSQEDLLTPIFVQSQPGLYLTSVWRDALGWKLGPFGRMCHWQLSLVFLGPTSEKKPQVNILYSNSLPLSSQVALGDPGGISGMIGIWAFDTFTTFSLQLWLIGCWLLPLLF